MGTCAHTHTHNMESVLNNNSLLLLLADIQVFDTMLSRVALIIK